MGVRGGGGSEGQAWVKSSAFCARERERERERERKKATLFLRTTSCKYLRPGLQYTAENGQYTTAWERKKKQEIKEVTTEQEQEERRGICRPLAKVSASLKGKVTTEPMTCH